ncbi:MAG: hypothetical protein ACLQOO_04615 [Terriglobia bacterium]
MGKDRKRGSAERSSIELVMQGYVVVAMISTSGWDVLLMATIFLLGIVTVRETVGRVTALF